MAAVLDHSEDSNGSEDSQMTQEFVPSDDELNVDENENHKRKGEPLENREVAKKPKKVNVGVVDLTESSQESVDEIGVGQPSTIGGECSRSGKEALVGLPNKSSPHLRLPYENPTTKVDWKSEPWIWASAETVNDDVGPDRSGNRRVIEKIHDRFNSGQKMPSVKEGALGSGELFNIAKSLVHSEKATTSGKWLLMNISGEEANGVWAAVREQVLNGSLGPQAKIGLQGEFYMICIYTRDFTDEEDVKRVVDHLGKMKCGSSSSSDSSYDDNLVVKAAKTISYKADIVTLWGSQKFNTTSITHGTFYQAKRDENNTLVFRRAEHTEKNGGKGLKVGVPRSS